MFLGRRLDDVTDPTTQVRPSAFLSSRLGGTAGAASHASIRHSNLALVTSALFQDGGGLSRADIATETGLTKATVSRLARELLEKNVVVEGVPGESSSAGRPGTPLFPAPGTMVGIGLEINVDRICGAAVDLQGQQVDSFEESCNLTNSDPEAAFRLLEPQVSAMLDRLEGMGATVVGASLAIPGIVDQTSQIVIYAPNLGWRMVAPGEYLLDALGCIPLFVDNDANLQALAVLSADIPDQESLPSSFFYLTGDIGIGGALIRDGEPVRGPQGRAGEIGHTTVHPDGPECHCGSRGCLERYAGKLAIAEEAAITFEDQLAPPPQVLVDALEEQNMDAIRAVDRAGWALGIALANVTNLLDVDTVVLGTSLAPLLPWLAPSLEKELKRRMIGSDSRTVELISAPPVASPAAVGGAILALQSGLVDSLLEP